MTRLQFWARSSGQPLCALRSRVFGSMGGFRGERIGQRPMKLLKGGLVLLSYWRSIEICNASMSLSLHQIVILLRLWMLEGGSGKLGIAAFQGTSSPGIDDMNCSSILACSNLPSLLARFNLDRL